MLLTVVALFLALGVDSSRELFRYDRVALAAGEHWRWLTAHLVHMGASHMLMNLAGLWVVWLLFVGRLGSAMGWWVTLISVVVMNAGFWFRDTELGWYVGLSGLLHGLFAAGALDEFWRGVRGGVLLLAGVTLKLAYEQGFGPLPMTAEASGGPVWVNSHLYGAMGGALAASLWNWRTPFTPGTRLRIFPRS